MLPTLRSLMRQRELALHLLTPEDALPAGALDAAIEWVHSSDLDDPTPFLSAGQVLLSTGTQFEAAPGAESVFAYVQRLRDVGVAGLGFGTEVVRAGTPDALLDACLQIGLPLFEVPYRTPFIAVARAASDMAAEERFARRSWSLGAQRAIAIAALRPDGLSASLEELSRQLGHWVALFNANGALDRVFPAGALAASQPAGPAAAAGADGLVDTVRREATRLLRRGQRASSTITAGGETLTLQTLGRREQLRGVLALGGSSELDQAGNEVVTAVIALAGLALEQNHSLDRARGQIRAAVLRALRHGDLALATSVSDGLWGELPAEPVRCAVVETRGGQLDAVTEHLEALVVEHPGRLFFAVDDGRLVLCLGEDGLPLLTELCSAFALRAGLSEPGAYSDLDRAMAQAEQALARAGDAVGVSEFGEIARDGVLSYLTTTDAGAIGRSVLQPLSEHDAAQHSELLRTLRLWLEQNGQLDATAQLLGVHRHTVRARIAQIEKLLGRDLSGFQERAELWAALLVAAE
ncbi:purine catabolism regulator [Microterricola gilva]|uniref:Purine catabolism regulator n=1 Tax=Microterricola gilva TaxID=393267 RepID=A0A4Q8APV7_9MICO|nr:PucR family transcriptional regulator [Microterricola gilva]RZU66628.1 purine catabolism regulator [Microterricola gilva]